MMYFYLKWKNKRPEDIYISKEKPENCNFIDEMSKRLNLPCYLNNDANLFTLGEYKSYSGNKDVFIGITLGTGLGFGIVINGKLFSVAESIKAFA